MRSGCGPQGGSGGPTGGGRVRSARSPLPTRNEERPPVTQSSPATTPAGTVRMDSASQSRGVAKAPARGGGSCCGGELTVPPKPLQPGCCLGAAGQRRAQSGLCTRADEGPSGRSGSLMETASSPRPGAHAHPRAGPFFTGQKGRRTEEHPGTLQAPDGVARVRGTQPRSQPCTSSKPASRSAPGAGRAGSTPRCCRVTRAGCSRPLGSAGLGHPEQTPSTAPSALASSGSG